MTARVGTRAIGVGLALAAVGAIGAPPALPAPAPKVARVAILGPGYPPNVEAFREGLRERGWVEGQNLLVETRFAEWHYERLPGLAAELVRWHPDVLYTNTTPGVLAAQDATRTLPIVGGAAGQLVEKGFVKSLSKPGGNITGLTLIDAELDAKRLQLLQEVLPRLRHVAVLHHPGNTRDAADSRPREEAARNLGLRLTDVEARDDADLGAAFAALTRVGAEALLVIHEAALDAIQGRIMELAMKDRLPVVSELPEWAEAGALLAYGPDSNAMFRRAAGYVDRILRGATPASLPVERPDTFTLMINLKTATALGLTLPPALVARADQAIQ